MTHSLISQLRHRGELSEVDADRLLGALGPVRTVPAGRDIVLDGSRPTESTVLLDGFAARYKVVGDGGRQISQLHVAGDFVDLHSFLLAEMDHGVTAITDCVVAGVPHEALDRLTAESLELSRILWLSTLIDAAVHRTWVTQLGRADAHRRTAHLICELYVRLQIVSRVRENGFDFGLTQVDLSDSLGMSSVHMNRTLMQLREEGLVEWKRSRISVSDFNRLKAVAGFDPTYLNLVRAPQLTTAGLSSAARC
jgi:CRP-like cAMP-binding protein